MNFDPPFYTVDAHQESLDSQCPHPHCDHLVLHAPGECKHCDKYPVRQSAWKEADINFTGESGSRSGISKPSPAEELRDVNVINRWYGNTPKK